MKWTNLGISYPFDGQVVALRMTDDGGNISYGIGWWNARDKEWHITAPPASGASNVHSWCALPD